MNVTRTIKANRIHMIGIGGSGMFPLAQILYAQGYRLSGSDNNPSATLEAEKKMGIELHLGHDAANIDGAELVVYSAAISPDNPELMAAREKGIPVMERAELLGLIADSHEKTVAVCGTHGKTTSTSMLTEILMKDGKDPSAVIGGKLASIGGSGRVGSGEYMTCEACEFRNTYHHIHPYIALILDVDLDHLEFFGNLENIIASFRKFACQARGCVVANGDDANTLKAVENISPRCHLFGTSAGCRYNARNISGKGPFFSFDYYISDRYIGRAELKIPGRHNVSNTLGVLGAADICGVDPADALKYAAEFRGAGRRFEFVGEYGGFTVADDYAHNPTELTVTINTAKQMDYRRVIAVFQPVTYSRTKLMLDGLAGALSLADKAIITPILGSREVNTYGIDSADLAAKVPGSILCDGFESAARAIADAAEPGDLVLTLGCGDIYKVMPYLKALTMKS